MMTRAAGAAHVTDGILCFAEFRLKVRLDDILAED
jgi:hypothetical protein